MRMQRRPCGRNLPGCSAPSALPATTRGCLPWSSCSQQQQSKNCSACHTLLLPTGHCLPRCGSSSGNGRTWLWRVQPHSPITHFLLGVRSSDPPAAARHLWHGLAIARQRHSDWWAARLAHQLAVLATANQVAAVPPAEAAGLLAEADAAYRRCDTVLPWMWVGELKRRWQAGPCGRPSRCTPSGVRQAGTALCGSWAANATARAGPQCRHTTMLGWEDEPGSLPLRRLPWYPVLQAEMRWGGGMPALAATTSTYVSCRMFPRCLLAGLSPPPPELLLIASATRLPPG